MSAVPDPFKMSRLARAELDAMRQAGESVGDDWADPKPLVAQQKPETYPVDYLPELVRDAVLEVQAFTHAPVALVAGCALTAISVAVQGHVNIQRAEKLLGPVSAYLLTIADSGERKSTCDSFFMKAILDYQQEQAEAMKPVVTAYKADIAAWRAEKDGLLQAIKEKSKKGAVSEEMRASLRELEATEPQEPKVPRLVLADETPESLAFSLAKKWPSAGLISAEAGAVLGGHAMSSDAQMRNLALLNVLWDGGSKEIGRRTSESFTVRDVRLTMGLQVQEPTLRAFFAKSGELARGTGFLARFLIAWPESTQGTRAFTDAPKAWPKLAAFNRRLSAILNQALPISDEGFLAPALLTLGADAKASWVRFHDEIEAELGSSGALYEVRDVASKTADNATRLAGLFHCFESGQMGPAAVAGQTFDDASQLALWHLSESRRFFGELALAPELSEAMRLDAWLVGYCRSNQCESVPARTVMQFGPRGVRNKAKVEAAIIELAELDRARWDRSGKGRVIAVNPKVLAHAV